MMTNYEKDHAGQLLAMVNDYIIAMTKVYKLADENGWDDLAAMLDEKMGDMEERSRELMREVVS